MAVIPERHVISASYEKWNEALCDYFFSSSRNKVVYLYANERVIIDVGSTLNLSPSESVSSFCNAVRSYVRNVNKLFLLAYKRGVRWYKQGAVGYPPFIGVLALCVLAATKMEKDDEEHIGGGNYYYRLRKLLNITNGKGMPVGFEKSVGLWKILLKWQRDSEGRFGYTYSFTFPGIPYSGYPRSQCLIRDTERAILYDFFEWGRYERGSNLSQSTVERDLRNYLSSRACRLNKLFFHKTRGIREAIVNMVIEEFNRWEPDYNPEAVSHNRIPVSVLLEFAGSVFDRVIKLSLVSAPIYIEERAVSAEGFEYRSGFYIREVQSINELKTDLSLSVDGNKFLHKGKGVFVFRKAEDKGLQGWLSRDDVAPQQEHLILYSVEHKTSVREWIDANSLQSHSSEIRDGVPNGWELIRIFIPEQISTMRGLAGVRYREKISVSLFCGLKIGYNRWLQGFTPVISVSAPRKSTITLNRVPLLCLIHGSALLDLRDRFSRSGSYELNVEGKVYHFQVVDSENYESPCFESSPFHKFTMDHGVEVGISGMYLYHNVKSLPKPCIMTGKGQVILTGEGRVVEKHAQESLLKCGPFVRSVDSLNVYSPKHPLTPERPIDCFVEYLHLRGRGNWNSFLQGIEICFGKRDPLIAYRVRRTLSELGIVEFRQESSGSNRLQWYSIPVTAYILPLREYVVALSGTLLIRKIFSIVTGALKVQVLIHNPESAFEPTTVYLTGETLEDINDCCAINNIRINYSTEDYFAYELVRSLPTIRQLVKDYSASCTEPLETLSFDGWDTNQHRWQSERDSPLKRYSFGYRRSVTLLDTELGKFRVDPDIGKFYLASEAGVPVFSYSDYRINVRKEYRLPELYARALTACSGRCPVESQYASTYVNVPGELALAVAFRLGINL